MLNSNELRQNLIELVINLIAETYPIQLCEVVRYDITKDECDLKLLSRRLLKTDLEYEDIIIPNIRVYRSNTTGLLEELKEGDIGLLLLAKGYNTPFIKEGEKQANFIFDEVIAELSGGIYFNIMGSIGERSLSTEEGKLKIEGKDKDIKITNESGVIEITRDGITINSNGSKIECKKDLTLESNTINFTSTPKQSGKEFIKVGDLVTIGATTGLISKT